MTLAAVETSINSTRTKFATASWLVAGSNLDPRFGGISAVVGRLCSAVAEAGSFDFCLAQFGRPAHRFPIGLQCASYAFPLANMPWLHSPRYWGLLERAVRDADGIHIHGIWQKHCAFTGFLARRSAKPYLISAHGMLDGWALGNKRWKKAAYSALIESRNLNGAACLHALTEAELADYRRIAPRTPVAVIPNGVEIVPASPAPFLDRFPALRNRQLILFLGRIHYKKGVDILVQAWSRIERRWPDAQLVLAGPDFEGTRARTESLVSSLQITSRVTFTGMLEAPEKWSALQSAHCFVLPSHSEGLSVSVLEALGSGVPAIVTPQCHLPEIGRTESGWVTEPRVADLVATLEEALRTSGAARDRMAANGRALVAARYSWPVVAAQMAELYTWVLGGSRPRAVEIV